MKYIYIFIGLLFFSCNDELWEEISSLKDINANQSLRILSLNHEIDSLNQTLIETENKLIDLITFGDDYNAEQIVENNKLILELSSDLSASLDSLSTDIENVESEASEALLEAVELINQEQEVLDSLIKVNVSGLEELSAQVDSIQPIINNYTLVTNVVDTSELEDRVSDIEAELACSDYDEVEPYALPEYEHHTIRNIRAYTEECDGSGEIIFEQLVFVKFGDKYRAYTAKDGWLGTFGLDENKMNIEGFPQGDKCYEHVEGPIEDFDAIPSIGEIAIGDLVDSDLELSYEFNPSTGEYTGCVNTSEDVEFFVNGVAVEGNSFDVGDLEGYYIVTAKIGDTVLQHEVEIALSSKGPVKGKVVKKVII